MELEADSLTHHLQRSEFIRKLVQGPLGQHPVNDRCAHLTPRTIVQFWHDLHHLPEDVEECIASWVHRGINGLSHRLFDERLGIGRGLEMALESPSRPQKLETIQSTQIPSSRRVASA